MEFDVEQVSARYGIRLEGLQGNGRRGQGRGDPCRPFGDAFI
jgi:hypothetical protein